MTTLWGKNTKIYHKQVVTVIKEQQKNSLPLFQKRQISACVAADSVVSLNPVTLRLGMIRCSKPLQVLIYSTVVYQAQSFFEVGDNSSVTPSLKDDFCSLKLDRALKSSKSLAKEVSGWKSCSGCLQNAIDEHTFPPEPLSCYGAEAGLFQW